VLYHILSTRFRYQNFLVLACSYVFYAWWNVRLLWLILLCSAIHYFAALAIAATDNAARKKLLLASSVGASVGILGAFKYYNFFAGNLATILGAVGFNADLPTLNLVLPIGISFYTFQSMAYTIDVYRGQTDPEKNPITFFAFISFFPQLVAGPIERAGHLLPQFNNPRAVTRDGLKESVWLLVWGYFLKVSIADFAGMYANLAYKADQGSGWMAILGTIAFGLQVYCDFHAYSLIARGSAGLLGFRIVYNFDHPYKSLSIREFWRRWHVSLGSWLRDYVYLSLGGNRKGVFRTYLNLMATMLICGLWHGAGWNFVLWGAWNGVFLMAERFFTKNLNLNVSVPRLVSWVYAMAVVFSGYLIFRCQSLEMMSAMVSSLGNLAWEPIHTRIAVSLAALSLPVAVVEIWQLKAGSQTAQARLGTVAFGVLAGFILLAIFVMLSARPDYEFIYFQF